MTERVMVSRFNTPRRKLKNRRSRALSHDLHLTARHDPHWLELHPLAETADGAVGYGGRDASHFLSGGIKESLDVLRPGCTAGGRARGFERGLKPGIKDPDSLFSFGAHAADGEDVAIIDGSSVDRFIDRSACGSVDARELVGEDGDADAGAAGEEAAGFGSGGCFAGGGADVVADALGDGVVLVGAKVDDLDSWFGAEVGEKGVLEVAAEGVGTGVDLERRGVVLGGGGHGALSVGEGLSQ